MDGGPVVGTMENYLNGMKDMGRKESKILPGF